MESKQQSVKVKVTKSLEAQVEKYSKNDKKEQTPKKAHETRVQFRHCNQEPIEDCAGIVVNVRQRGYEKSSYRHSTL